MHDLNGRESLQVQSGRLLADGLDHLDEMLRAAIVQLKTANPKG